LKRGAVNFWHDAQRQLLIYQPPSTFHIDGVLKHIPEARQINGSYLAVPQTLRNSQVMRWLGYQVAPVITDANYSWPASPGVTPWEHQKLAANFAVLHPRSFNLSDLGSGKTLSLLWATDFLMKQFPPGQCRCLIVAPLSTLSSVWGQNIFANFLGNRTFEILHGSAEKRLELLKRDVDYFIVNHDGVGVGAHTRRKFELDGFSAALAARSDIQICVVDEASAYKDAQTKRHRIARLVFGKKPYLFMLTGTPTPQRPTDAYGLAKMMNGAYGKSFKTFEQETMVQVSMYKWVPRTDGYEQARKMLQPAIRFDIEAVWKDAPEMTIQTREAALTKEQVTLMASLKRDLQVAVKSGQQINAVNEAAARTKFLQISLGAIYDENHKVHTIDAAPRLAVLKEIIDQSPRKILLLTGFTSVLTRLAKELKNYSVAIVNGSVSMKERSEIFRRFQDEVDPEIIIADPGVLAHGLNLQRGRTIIWFSPCDKGELFQQANARCHRPGQKFPVSVVQIVSNPLEQEIYKRLAANASLQGALLDAIGRGE
jgi:SNF2 family DNA or RNA helicase